MKRRKFLQILGLTAAAPTAVLACPPVARPWPNPDTNLTLTGKETAELICKGGWKGDNAIEPDVIIPEPNRVKLEIRPYLTDEDYASVRIYPVEPSHEFAFPDKPIFPNYLHTNA